MPITQKRLKEVLSYDQVSGYFTWLVAIGNRIKVGQVAGFDNGKGYINIQIDGETYRAHRLAVLYMTGRMPTHQVDHRDLNRSNNAWDNLRDATNAQNTANAPAQKNNKLGIKGVSTAGSRFLSQICVRGNKIRLGLFDTPEEAHDAYVKAANDNFGEFARAA